MMCEPVEGDYVLLEHDMLMDTFQVRRVIKVHKTFMDVERIVADSDGYAHPQRRKKTALVGFFSSFNKAQDAQMRIGPIYDSLRRRLKEVTLEHRTEVKSLLG